MSEPNEISALVRSILPELDDPPVSHAIQESLVTFWMENVGSIASKSYPILFESGRMVVICHSPVWTTQLRNMVPSLVRQLTDANFDVGSIQVKTSPKTVDPHNPPETEISPEKLSAENARAMGSLSDRLHHRGLGDALKKLSMRSKNESQ